MANLADLQQALVNADRAGDTAAATALAGEITRQKAMSVPDQAEPAPQAQDKRSGLQKRDDALKGMGEALLSLATGATTGLIGRAGGTIGGIAGSIATGKYGTHEGAAEAGQAAEDAAHRFTYEPKTQEGRDVLASLSKAFDSSKLAGLGPNEVMPMPGTLTAEARGIAGQQAGEAAQTARQAVRDMRAKIGTEAPAMAGVGSAATDAATLRRQRAESLPVPIQLTEGQATRDFAQQQFEREAAKNPDIGEPLRQRFSEQNQKILQNFDSWVDQTGAQAGSLRATGQAVTDAVVQKSNKAKMEIRDAYRKAEQGGAMQEQVDVAPLASYLAGHEAEAINAPVITSAQMKLKSLAKDGTVSVGDLEEIRKMVGNLSGKDATNAHFGGEVKGVIDQMTEGKGGDLYKRARALRSQYGREFEDHAVVDKLLSTKPGSKDRAVAYEDVFDHAILKGSLDDVRTMRKTLQTAGPQGEQAWKELQGSTIQYIRDEITKNVQIDSAGNRVISPARLNKIVTELDKDGKLDFVFGKQGAQQIRDVNGIAQDAFTAPPGSVNHSNTASILSKALDQVASKATGIPFAGAALGYASKEVRNAKDRKRVREALK